MYKFEDNTNKNIKVNKITLNNTSNSTVLNIFFLTLILIIMWLNRNELFCK